MSTSKFAETHNLVAFLENPKKFWATAKTKTVNEECQIQDLVDKKKVIIIEKSVRSDLMLDDAEGTKCLPDDVIFEQLTLMGAKTTAWNEFSSTMVSSIIFFMDKQVEGMNRHKEVYVTPSHTKKVFANMKIPGKGFSRRVTPLFPTMMKKSRRKQRKDSGPTELVTNEAHVSTPSYDPPQSGKDSMQLSELMNLCNRLQEKVLDLEKLKTAQAKEIASLKKRLKQLEKKRKLRTLGLKRLRKVGSTSRVESSNDVSLGDQEDASKQGRKIVNLDADAQVTLVDETQEMNDDNLLFDTDVLEEQEKEVAKKEVSTADLVTTAGEVVTTANVEATTINAPTTTIHELTLAQTLIEIKAAKPKVVTSAATTTTTTRPKARGVIVQEPSNNGWLEKPLKKKDQIAIDKEVARNLEAQLQAKLEEKERLSRLKEEEANIALLESWDNTQAMMDADF
ncbi:hypothetical protein Tco_0831147 [Tanacetum coccineum]